MLKELFGSQSRVKILTNFFLNSEKEFFIRELTRKLDEQINSVRRELDNLRKIGILKSRSRNRKKYYFLNQNFIFYQELKNIFIKATSSQEDVSRAIARIGKIELLLLSGFFVNNKEATIDLLIVGEIAKDKLSEYLSSNFKNEGDIRFTIINRDNFLYRLKYNDKFIRELLSDERNILAINKFKEDINTLKIEKA